MDHVNRLLIMLALVLCVLMVLVLHSPITNGLTFAVNTVDSALPGHASSPLALAPSRPSTATPSPTGGDGAGNGSGTKPTATPVPSFPVLPTLPPIFPTPRPTVISPLTFNQAHRGTLNLDFRFGENDGGSILSRLGASDQGSEARFGLRN